MTVKPLWNHYEMTMNSLRRDFIMNTLFYLEFIISFANPLSFSRFHLESTFFRRITKNSLSVSRFHYEYTIFFANSLSVSQIFYEFTICLAISLWIYFLFREFTLTPFFTTKSLWTHYLFHEINMNSLSASRFHFEFNILFP